MAGKRRSAAQIARDRRRIADLYLRGELQVAIAEEVGISQTTVSRDLKALQAEWLKSSLIDYNEVKAQELARIDTLEREYWQAWQRSCEDAETIRKKKAEIAGVKRKEIVTTAKGQVGDPRFLTGVQWCIERRCKVLGIDAPDKVEGSVILEIAYAKTGQETAAEPVGLRDERQERVPAERGVGKRED